MIVLLGVASSAQAAWVTFVNQTTTRMPTGPGLNDPATSTADVEEKDYQWGDVDNDGDIDLICMRKIPFTFAGGKTDVLFMNENGVLIDRTALYAAESINVPAGEGTSHGFQDLTNTRKSILMDINNDGWLDIVTAITISDGLPKYIGQPRVYINKGEIDGVWQGFQYDYNRIPQLLSKTGVVANPRFCSIVAGDVNGDGYIDLYFSDYDSGEVGPPENGANDYDNKLLMNSGAANPGYFTDQSTARMGALYNYAGVGNKNLLYATFGAEAVVADMNGDGYKDVVKITTLTTPIHVAMLTNPPANPGFWTSASYKPFYSLAPYFVSAGDLNGDGKLDLVITDDGTDRYLLNTGNDVNGAANFTSFTVQSALGVEADFGSQSVIVDLNNDGWNDVLIDDVDADTFGCARRTCIYQNLGNAPNITLKEQSPSVIPTAMLKGVHNIAVFDIDGDGWKDIVLGRCATTEVWMNVPPASLTISYPSGHPAALTPDQPTTFQVQLTGANGGIPMANSGKITISIDGASSTTTSMTPLGGDLYEATIPATACPSNVRYSLSGQVSTGGTFNDPPKSGTFFSARAVSSVNTVLNDAANRLGAWTVTNDPSLTSGAWVAAVPVGTWNEGFRAAPNADHTTGSGSAFVTQNGAPGGPPLAASVHGGATALISPTIDLTGSNATISFARWFYSSTTQPALSVSVSNNNGATWVPVASYAGASANGPQPSSQATTWQVSSFVVGDFVAPSAQVKVKFSVSSTQPGAIVEAGVDDFQVDQFICAIPCPADINGSGAVNVDDLLAVINAWGPCAGCTADINADGVVNVDDLLAVINAWGACP